MLAKCANPSCSRLFRYLREGKLFWLEPTQPNGRSPNPHGEWFWLCEQCSRVMTPRRDDEGAVAAHLVMQIKGGCSPRP